jgi:hypothetical protein
MMQNVQDGRIYIHNEERSIRPSVVSNGLLQNVGQKICGNGACEFPQIPQPLLYEIITVRLRLSQTLHKMCSENDHGCA